MLCMGLRPQRKKESLSASSYCISISLSANWWCPAILHEEGKLERGRERIVEIMNKIFIGHDVVAMKVCRSDYTIVQFRFLPMSLQNCV